MDERIVAAVLQELERRGADPRPRARLYGSPPTRESGYHYVSEPPFQALVIGSLTLHELLFPPDIILQALCNGERVLYAPEGLPSVDAGTPRTLQMRIKEAERALRLWGAKPIGTASGALITAETAKKLRAQQLPLPPGARLTPLAREIWKGD